MIMVKFIREATLLVLATTSFLCAASEQAALTILETSDIHSFIWSYDYFKDTVDHTVGLSKVATLIREARENRDNVLYFDNGDVLQGNPLSDFIVKRGVNGTEEGIHPVIAALNTLEPDAATIGNHEFNYGVKFLMDSMNQSAYPVVCSNVVDAPNLVDPLADKLLFEPFVILDRTITTKSGNRIPIKIGVIGWVPSQIMQWDNAHLKDRYNAWGIGHAAKAWIPKMKEQGADIVIALSHSGVKGTPDNPDNWEDEEMNSLFTAQHVPDLDVILVGHAHLQLPGTDYEGVPDVLTGSGRASLHGIPATMPGFWGSHLGEIELELSYEENQWSVAGFNSTIIPVYSKDEDGKPIPLVEEDEMILEVTKAAHEETLKYVQTPVGETTTRIHTYFANVHDDLSVQLVNKAMISYIEPMLGTEGLPNDLPLLSAAAPFKVGGRGGVNYYTDVPAGPLTIANVADLYLYPNTLRVVQVNGTCVKGWIEQSGKMFKTVDPQSSSEQNILNPLYAAYNFDVLEGCLYTYDLTQEEGSRVASLVCRGHDLFEDDSQEFLVIANNYRAEGNDFPCLGGESIIFTAPDSARDVLTRYIMEKDAITSSQNKSWGLQPVPGVKLVFESSPAGVDACAGESDIRPLREAEKGFYLYEVVGEGPLSADPGLAPISSDVSFIATAFVAIHLAYQLCRNM